VFVVRMVMVAAGEFHSAGVTADGTLLTSLRGADGQLGHGDMQSRLRQNQISRECLAKASGNGRLRGFTHNIIDGGWPVDLPRRKTWQTGAR